WHILYLKATCTPLLKLHAQFPLGVCRHKSTRSWLRSPFQTKSPEALARKDGLNSAHDHLIYNSGLQSYLLLASCSSSGIALAGIALATTLWWKSAQPEQQTKLSPVQPSTIEVFESPFQLGVGCCLVTVFMLFGVYIVSHFPVRIYYSPSRQVFHMVFQRAVPGLRKVRTCRPGGLAPLVGRRDSVSMQMLGNVVERDSNKRLMVLEHRFKTMAYYNVLMGFDSVEVLSEETDTWPELYRRHVH
ncbi:unnamed protein product, partial [Ixodes hexagonus]